LQPLVFAVRMASSAPDLFPCAGNLVAALSRDSDAVMS
jgi:hypothetical protein